MIGNRTLARTVLIALSLAAPVALALVVATCGGGGGGSPTAPPTPPAPQMVTVQVSDNSFSPQSVTVNPGDTVRWVLQGSDSGHTVIERNGVFSSGAVFHAAGDSFSHTFTTADSGRTFEYYCQTHRGCCLMQGSVRVGQNAPIPSPGY